MQLWIMDRSQKAVAKWRRERRTSFFFFFAQTCVPRQRSSCLSQPFHIYMKMDEEVEVEWTILSPVRGYMHLGLAGGGPNLSLLKALHQLGNGNVSRLIDQPP